MNLNFMQDFYNRFSIGEGVQVVLSIGLMLIVAFLLTRLTKLVKLPNVTAYIISGVLIGPFVLNFIPKNLIQHMDFVTDIALGFIAFGVGKYFDFKTIKKNGLGVIVITCMESFLAAIVVTMTMYLVFHLEMAFCLLLGAIGAATSPASTIMTIRQYRCRGNFVDNVLEVVALDDATSLLAFSVCSAIAVALLGTTGGAADFNIFKSIVLPILLNIAAIGLGALFGYLLVKIITPRRTADNRLILTVAMILLLVGICGLGTVIDANLSISPLLACMVFGTVYVNMTKDKVLFFQLNDFSAPITLLFFVKSGLAFDINSLATAGVIGIVYFFVRIVGKYAGASLGGWLTKAKPEVTKYLGMALVPQAGVSIGLATLGARILGTGADGTDYGAMLATIIISSGILYELVGPALARLSLSISGSMPDKNGKVRDDLAAEEQASDPSSAPAEIPVNLKKVRRSIFQKKVAAPLVFIADQDPERLEAREQEMKRAQLVALQDQIRILNKEVHLEQRMGDVRTPTEMTGSFGVGPLKHKRFADKDDRHS